MSSKEAVDKMINYRYNYRMEIKNMKTEIITLCDGTEAKLLTFDEIDSTNTYLKNLAKNGERNLTVVIADRQSGGRGRLGRSFVSENNCGLYMSVLLKPDGRLNATSLTAITGISVNEAIYEVFGLKCGIKWVNDIILNDKKVCGILAEGSLNVSGELDFVVMGIGVNIAPPTGGYPEEIKDIAGALCENYSKEIRNRLAFTILERLCTNLKSDLTDLLDTYIKMSCVIGKRVNVIGPEHSYPATVIGLDDDFGLTVMKDDGVTEILRYGEISIRNEKR